MSDRQVLRELHQQRVDTQASAETWEGLNAKAQAQKQGAMLVHSLGLTADQLRAAQLHRLDPMVAEALVELSEKFEGVNRLEILSQYDSEAALAGLRSTTRGTLMELEVESLIDSGEIDLPEGAVSFEAAGRNEPAADGWFLDDDGEIIQQMQIKASDDAAIILRHLREHPDVPDVYTTSEAADAAARRGLESVTDTGIENVELTELVDGGLSAAGAGEWLTANVPLITLGLAAAEMARNLHKGMELAEAREVASQRVGVALSYSALAWMVAAFSGIEAARFGVVLTGEGSRWVVRRMGDELEPSIMRLQEQRAVLTSLRSESAPSVSATV